MTQEQIWLKKRGKSIGSSEIAAILGLDRFKTKYQLWLKKTGREKNPFQGNKATARGKALEKAVAAFYLEPDNEQYAQYGLVPNGRNIIFHPDYPFLSATPDYWLCDPADQAALTKLARKALSDSKKAYKQGKKILPNFDPLYQTGKLKGIFECKTAISQAVANSEDYWTCQTAWQLGLATSNGYCGGVVILGVLEPTKYDFAFSYRESTMEEMKLLYDIEVHEGVRFWNENVLADIEPEIQPKDAKYAFGDPEIKSEPILASPELIQLITDYQQASQSIRELEGQKQEIKELIALAVGFSDEIVDIHGQRVATYKWQNGRMTIDSKRLAAELPEIAAKYSQRGDSFRVLRPKI